MKKLLLSLLLCLTLGSAAAWAQEAEAFALKFVKSDYTSSIQNYTSTWNHTYNNRTWSISNFSNNQKSWEYVRTGAKKSTTSSYIATKTIAEEAISAIAIDITRIANGSVTAVSLEIADDANFTNSTTITATAPSAVGELKISIPAPAENKYYKLNFTCNNTSSSNGVLDINSITYYYEVISGPVAPGEVLVNGDATTEDFTFVQGDKIEFTSAKAAKLVATIEGEGDAVTETAEGAAYTHTADFAKYGDEYMITVTPYDSEGTEYKDLAKTVMLTKKAAELCGEVTFTPAGGAVNEGTAVKLACKNAAKIFYAIDGGSELEYNDETGIIITKACKINAYGVNADGVHGETATAEYSIKEADRYALVNNIKDLKSGAQYIIVSEGNNGLGTYGDTRYNAIKNVVINDGVVTVADNSGFTAFVIEANGEGYTLTTTAGNKISASASATGLTQGTSNSTFDIAFENGFAKISITSGSNSRQILLNKNNVSSLLFRFYNTSVATDKNYEQIRLYRLIDEEYDSFVPEELHVHGDFYDTSWERSEPMVKDGKVFTFVDLWVQDHDGSHSIVFATCALDHNVSTTPEATRRKAPAASYWADNGLEGHVLVPTAEGTLTRVHTSEHSTDENGVFTVPEPYKYYDLTADFSGYGAPKFSISEGRDNPTTGVGNINADANEPVEFFNLQGVRVANPESGIYIRRQGKTVSKVLVK